MNTEQQSHRTRVILGATCFADADASLQIAVVLAKQTRGILHGCLVTDDAVLRSTTLPNTRTLAYSGKSTCDTTMKSMDSAFRVDAEHFRSRLGAAARSAALESNFSHATGRLSKILYDTAKIGDFVIFGYRQAVRNGNFVLLTFGGAPPTSMLLQMGVDLSNALRKPLVISASPAFEAEISREMTRLQKPIFVFNPYENTKSFLRYVNKMSPAAVVVGFETPKMSSIMRVIDAARCPVIVPITQRLEPKTDNPNSEQSQHR